ncbi:MAG: flagellar hook protein FlgE, partial [Dactylosporangium sp.]|nr:flagellar hook protein FlgE [Dactylosporangium sp.]
MMRALFSGVSGLQNHQIRMDVVADNIANVNTVGFKASRVVFAEAMAQMLRGAGAPQTATGGTNPQQIGLGVQIASIDTILNPGSTQVTGVNTDMAIDGDGYFILQGPSGLEFTRAGSFVRDADGYLVAPAGKRVMGWQADAAGVLPVTDATTMGPIKIDESLTLPAQPSTAPVFSGNLDAAAATGSSVSATVTVVDSLGTEHTLILTFTKTATANEWSWSLADAVAPGTPLATSGANPLTFNASGVATTNTTFAYSYAPGGGAATMNLNFDLGAITQYAEADSVHGEADGHGPEVLTSLGVDSSGTITGTFSGGDTLVLARVALATFANPAGLTRAGGNVFQSSANSGDPQVGSPGTGSRGGVIPGSLEMGNVDLAQQFTDMITTERGFQANARIITTADEMLQELAS